jgi:predicted nucleotidyltransferase
VSREVAASLVTGSKMYGIDLPESDTDMVTIYYPTVREMLGMEKFKRVGGNRSSYTLLDIVNLLLKGAPNICELLFATPEKSSPEWDLLTFMRNALWTDKQASAVMGFMKGHTKDICQRRAALLVLGAVKTRFTPTRDEAEYGWDTKKGAHVLRWWYQLAEYAATEEIVFPFSEERRDILLDIRTGKRSFSEWERRCAAYDELLTPVVGSFTVDQAKELIEVYLVALFRIVENKS